MLKSNASQINNALANAQEKVIPYDPQDMRAVLDNQKGVLKDLLTKNAILICANSQLRIHLSLMPDASAVWRFCCQFASNEQPAQNIWQGN
jgi:hypothetical protein